MQKKLICLVCTIFILFNTVQLRGASGTDTVFRSPVWLSARYAYGFIIPHHKSMEAFTRNHVAVYEVSVSFSNEFTPGYSGSAMHPGVSYFFSRLSDTRILGDVHAVIPWIEKPLRYHDFSFSARVGLGLGWVTNPFDLETNFRNTAIGSHLNAAILLNMGLNYRTTPRWIWSTGVNFVHFSNGSTVQPNYGINLPLVYGGVAYNLVTPRGRWQPVKDTGRFKRIIAGLQVVAGKKEIFPVNGPSYLSMLGAARFGFRFSKHFAAITAFDVSYNESDIDYLKRKGVEVSSRSEVIKTGMSLGMEQQFGRMTLSFRFGRYLHQLEDSDGPWYDVLALSCRLVKGLGAGLSLKTHFARADFIGFGLNYNFEF